MQDNTLQEIKDRLDIVDVISGYLRLKKAGVNFKAPCPFHHEKTPSLVVSPQKQIWHCFGCGEGGDVFGFVMRHENLDFREALKQLADKAGVKLPEYRPQDPAEQGEKEILLRINDFAARFYHKVLIEDKQGRSALDYLKSRGLTSGTMQRWQIGFAPEDFHALEKALVKKKVSLEEAVKAGVSVKNERGQIYDRFRGRITFPIYNYNGETVGFSARILSDDGKSAKYVNSPETLIYNKSRTVFGLNFAKNAIRKQDEAVIVEGQMDCITAHQAGFENVVASSGTALTAEQLTMLGRLTKNLKFCFDSDAAGQNASRRAGELALRQGFRLKVVELDQVKDPDELIKKSPGLWEKAVGEAKWFLDWQMDAAEKFAEDRLQQKHFLGETVIPLLGSVADPLELDHYIRRMAEKFGISERTIREQIKKQSAPKTFSAQSAGSPGLSQSNVLEKELLGGMLLYADFGEKVCKLGLVLDFADPEIGRLAGLVCQGRVDEVKHEGVAKEGLFMVESSRDELEGGEEQLRRQLDRSLAYFRLNSIKRKQQQLAAEIKQAESLGNREQLAKLSQDFAAVSRERLGLEKLL